MPRFLLTAFYALPRAGRTANPCRLSDILFCTETSTFCTMSGLTQLPPGSFGHSRRSPRGHMRSGNWSQTPTMPPAVDTEREEKGETAGHHSHGHDHHDGNSEHTNGHSHNHSHKPDIVPGHNHTHSASHSHGHSHAHADSLSHSHSIADGGLAAHIHGSDSVPTAGVKTSDAYATPFQASENAPLRLVQ